MMYIVSHPRIERSLRVDGMLDSLIQTCTETPMQCTDSIRQRKKGCAMIRWCAPLQGLKRATERRTSLSKNGVAFKMVL